MGKGEVGVNEERKGEVGVDEERKGGKTYDGEVWNGGHKEEGEDFDDVA